MPMGTATQCATCPTCARGAKRVFSVPMTYRTSQPLATMLAREEASRDYPEIVERVPPPSRPRRPRTSWLAFPSSRVRSRSAASSARSPGPARAIDTSVIRPTGPGAVQGGLAMPEVVFHVDQSKSMRDQEVPGHNRWHPDIPSVAFVRPGGEFRVECREWTDAQLGNNDSA